MINTVNILILTYLANQAATTLGAGKTYTLKGNGNKPTVALSSVILVNAGKTLTVDNLNLQTSGGSTYAVSVAGGIF